MSIVLFTDFGASDPYVGQVKAVLSRTAPGVPIIDLLHEVPSFDVVAGAHLLAALSMQFWPGDVFFAVVDPGVGGPRAPAVLWADERWYVGPDNGLLSVVAQRARQTRTWHILWRAPQMSQTFHGRDLFAPIAAAIACDALPPERLQACPSLNVLLPPEAQQIVFIDHYGNCMTGIPGSTLEPEHLLECGATRIRYAPTYSAVVAREPFWYVNSIGLVEVAVNEGSAAEFLGLRNGSTVRLMAPSARV
jgi:S-adenosylmethionine hydrolase